MAMRIFSRDEWEERLRRYKTKPLAGKTKLNKAEWWRAEWGYLFTVPVDDDGSISQRDFEHVIADLMKSAPPGYDFSS